MARIVDKSSFESWNDEMARRYDPDAFHHHPSPLVRFIEGRRVKAVLSYLNPVEGTKVLEVGCGAGNVLEQIRGAELHGVDLCDHLLEKAGRRLGARAKLVKADAESLPYADGSFDRIYCTEVLEHVLEPRKVLAEMHRVLRPDGIAVVSVPNERLINELKKHVLKSRIGRLMLGTKSGGYKSSERMDDEWHLHSFDLGLLHEVIADLFTVDHLSAIPFPGLPIRYAARLKPMKQDD